MFHFSLSTLIRRTLNCVGYTQHTLEYTFTWANTLHMTAFEHFTAKKWEKVLKFQQMERQCPRNERMAHNSYGEVLSPSFSVPVRKCTAICVKLNEREVFCL